METGIGLSSRRKLAGFTVVELLVVIAIILIASAFAIPQLMQSIRAARVNTAYHLTLSSLRSAQRLAVDRRQMVRVTFDAANAAIITDVRQPGSGLMVPLSTLPLPQEIGFTTVAGIPTALASTPDRIGNGALAVDFAATNEVYFYPDGAAKDVLGRNVNGVVYIARAGELYSSRAVTLLGAVGRVKGWRLVDVSGTPTWFAF